MKQYLYLIYLVFFMLFVSLGLLAFVGLATEAQEGIRSFLLYRMGV